MSEKIFKKTNLMFLKYIFVKEIRIYKNLKTLKTYHFLKKMFESNAIKINLSNVENQ